MPSKLLFVYEHICSVIYPSWKGIGTFFPFSFPNRTVWFSLVFHCVKKVVFKKPALHIVVRVVRLRQAWSL